MVRPLIVGCLVVLFGAAGCVQATPAAVSPAPPTAVYGAATETPTAITPALAVADQTLTGDTVTIPSVTAAEQGWLVIHTDSDGKPGPVIGWTAVQPGENTDVSVTIDPSKVTETLFAMLHVDRGTPGTYEFPGADGPVTVEGKVLVQPFRVTVAAMAATVTVVENEALGRFLADAKGMTLYLFLQDEPGKSNCYDRCAQNWPPLLVEGEPVAGEGVNPDLLGVTVRTDGTRQVTYNGWPLYYFVRDEKPGDTNGQDVGKVWYVISPEGEKVSEEEEVRVTIKGFKFTEAEIAIEAGTTVVWRNDDGAAHTVTADGGLFNSGNLNQGDEFEFTFTEAGEYTYHCAYHPSMTGKITVQ